MKKSVLFSRGIGLLEVVVSIGLLSVVFVGLFGVLQLGTRLATDNKSRTGASALALERMEFIRSLDYDSIGTVGGDPSGLLATSEAITLNGVPYTRRTVIVYVDDPQDGSGGADSNGITDDYKRMKVEVSWTGKTGARSVSVASDVAPPRIEE